MGEVLLAALGGKAKAAGLAESAPQNANGAQALG